MIEVEILQYIKKTYGPILSIAAIQYRHRAEILAGVMMRESEGGLSRYLDVPGPAGRGDHGHGHGLMQIDDRSFPEFCGGETWKDPGQNIAFACRVLSGKRRYLASHTLGMGLTDADLERAYIAAYNAGEGRILGVIRNHSNMDIATTHGNYSTEVLRFAEIYKIEEDTWIA